MKLRVLVVFGVLMGFLQAQVTFDRLLHANQEPENWLTYSGTYASHRYSLLTQIDRNNVKNLQLKWVWRPTTTPADEKMENTPIVVDGVLYATSLTEVVALDAATGGQYWKLSRPFNPDDFPMQRMYLVNKGVAIEGNTLFWTTGWDDHLLAIDASTGRVKWEVAAADWRKGYQLNVPPLVVKNMVIVGPATDDMGANCFIAAFDIHTGKEIWKFYTSPNTADDPAAKTWAGDTWKHGGSPVWNDGSYDPETNLVFFGTGNPNPGWNGDERSPGGKFDNLYSDSVVALDADTGKLKWYFQFTPDDEYDYDSTQVPVLADIDWQGKPRKVMMWANRNGIFYVLDRATGEFLLGKPFVKVNWTSGFDAKGKPIRALQTSTSGIRVYPGNQGGTNWYNPAFSPRTGLFYIPTWENSSTTYVKDQEPPEFHTGQTFSGKFPQGGAKGDDVYSAVRAIDPQTGEKKWDYRLAAPSTEAGIMTTASDLLFSGGRDGAFYALDARNGKLLWETNLGPSVSAGPMTYSVNGKQFVSIQAGSALFTFGLP